jgi:hypothetical protein
VGRGEGGREGDGKWKNEFLFALMMMGGVVMVVMVVL